MLRPGTNVWRVEHADRAAVLIDGAVYFRALREALIRARHSVVIVGWDIHSRTRLVGETGRADDGFPETLAGFLTALVRRRPELHICLLLWDYSMLYAMERELFPSLALHWRTPLQVHFCLDDAVPLGAAQHQKLVVIDEALAFSGGLDVTIRRWDRPVHDLDDPRRVDPAGIPYRPFHDVQMLVDGPAARALAELAHSRWELVACEPVPSGAAVDDPWPPGVVPDFTDVQVGIARTEPEFGGRQAVREVERLFLDSIDAAEHAIYIENQFLTSAGLAERLAGRLRQRPALEAVIVGPRTADSWLATRTMTPGRIRFRQILEAAGVADRVRLVYPEVSAGARSTDVMVHSKVMIVDDRLLRVGSANLNNRSMGTDTECDLVIEGAGPAQRRTIARLRDTLIAEHCGASAEDARIAIGQTGSLLSVVDRLQRSGHRLRPIDDGEAGDSELSCRPQAVGDPYHPLRAAALAHPTLADRARRRHTTAAVKAAAAAVVILALALSWQYTPLAHFAAPEFIRDALEPLVRSGFALLAVVAVFVLGGLLAFPVTVLIAATAAVFGPWLGFAFAATGALGSAVVTYALGRGLGTGTLAVLLGPRLNRIRQRIARQGVLAVAVIRLVPIAPFTVVNLVAGAAGIRLRDYVIGTLIGLAPGMIVLSALSHQIVRILAHPSGPEIALLVGAAALWIAVSVGANVLVSWLGREQA